MCKAHNAKRRSVVPTASNMIELKWSAELASVAENYSRKCVYGHNPNKYDEAPSFKRVGENLRYSTREETPLEVVSSWDDERIDYNYNANTCAPDKKCGHYTQVAWAETEYVGCAVTKCTPLVGKSDSAYYYVCNYGERGNMNGNRPYISGTPCSQCPSGYTCSNKLCRL
ncbi:peptidase inhibitor 16-like [Saccostrea echinata]|uniref:peptidase inhibitor 16-like n=1 Tax=Saccostrea echinata TaxID=191078 RepID=UPI002A83F44F|nr:peptidase inhibitor 16-like [Saccostrea echinata]